MLGIDLDVVMFIMFFCFYRIFLSIYGFYFMVELCGVWREKIVCFSIYNYWLILLKVYLVFLNLSYNFICGYLKKVSILDRKKMCYKVKLGMRCCFFSFIFL